MHGYVQRGLPPPLVSYCRALRTPTLGAAHPAVSTGAPRPLAPSGHTQLWALHHYQPHGSTTAEDGGHGSHEPRVCPSTRHAGRCAGGQPLSTIPTTPYIPSPPPLTLLGKPTHGAGTGRGRCRRHLPHALHFSPPWAMRSRRLRGPSSRSDRDRRSTHITSGRCGGTPPTRWVPFVG